MVAVRKKDPDAEKVIDRWTPRLADTSSEVREEAATKLAELATSTTASRQQVVPMLFDAARSTDEWQIQSAVLRGTADIPKTDRQWFLGFVEFYRDLTTAKDEDIRRWCYGYLADLITESNAQPSDPVLQGVVAMARRDEPKRTEGERKSILAILDWAEDNA